MTYDELREAVLNIAQEVAAWHQDNSHVMKTYGIAAYDEARADMWADATDAITQLAKDIA